MVSSIRKLIGARIKALRSQNAKTQAEVAEAVGCEVTTLGRYERGESAPDGEQLVKMAIFFSVSPMELLPGEIDVDRQAVLDLRSLLVDLIHSIDDPAELQRLIMLVKASDKTLSSPR